MSRHIIGKAPGVPLGCARTMLARLGKSMAGTLVGATALLASAPGAHAQADGAAQRLVDRYSPVVMVREQNDPPCDTAEEQYQPTTVDTVLGNPTVTLRRKGSGRRLEDLGTAPTRAQIAGKGDDHYLDLRGNPRGDTCVYARDFKQLLRDGKAPVVTYAHIAREAGRPGLAVQYWFFWYFNQFNDLHEGDWEGMQIVFDGADGPATALRQEPSEVIVFQHAGGERAAWDASKVEKDGTHPIVYAAAGSHATFYSSAVYVENGEHGSGLGCDNTAEPLRELRPRPVLLPDDVSDRGPFAWLSYEGHWGQRETGFNNGPTGPITKTQWSQPMSWMEQQRSTSARLPGGAIFGPQVTSAFCGTVAFVTSIMNLPTTGRTVAIGVLALLAILIACFVLVTRWRPVDVEHLRTRRAFGQVLRTAARLYRGHWALMLSSTVVPLAIVGGLQYAIATLTGGSTAATTIQDLVDTLSRPVAAAIVSGVVVGMLLALERTGRAGVVGSWRTMLGRFWRLVAAHLLYSVALAVLLLTVVGIPFAIWKVVGWAFVQQEILFEDRRIRDAFRSSSALVRGRWRHAARPIVFFYVLGLVAGPVVSFALIFTALPLVWIDVVGAAIFALLLPYAALGTTLVYFDLQARARTEPARPGRIRRALRAVLPRRAEKPVSGPSQPSAT
ncbi:flippase-like domain-containing protein [Capillimicrobium parvum]|uniref:DUF946 domain-containing protein n=1 Tax=Capillimicrobium parvum TaxID=2884022 RepID=A0A9E7C3E9_9ACTN|nr:flippase-like domain-containing protein [Capillimicrobium parvum]UGS38383.1 hypothetical protein DSM104329_04807 [Capillimicrobium parvum]